MKLIVIIFANQKGGVGKTTCCRELGIYFASLGKKILFIDADPQGNLTNGLIVNDSKNGLFEALTGGEYIFKKYSDNIYILSGDSRLTGLSKSLVGEIDAYTRLKALLQDEKFKELAQHHLTSACSVNNGAGFDYIFIDSLPGFDALTINCLTACSDVIIPMSPAEYTLQGTNDLLLSISKVKTNYNPEIKITGVIINAYDARPVITREIREEIQGVFGDKVFNSVLSKTIKIEEAISQKKGIIYLNEKAKEEISSIGNELLKRLATAPPSKLGSAVQGGV